MRNPALRLMNILDDNVGLELELIAQRLGGITAFVVSDDDAQLRRRQPGKRLPGKPLE
jgi:hypothetical protein